MQIIEVAMIDRDAIPHHVFVDWSLKLPIRLVSSRKPIDEVRLVAKVCEFRLNCVDRALNCATKPPRDDSSRIIR